MTTLGCIADDFTGATDLAGLLARSGVRVRLHAGLPTCSPQDDTAAIEIIALKIRTTSVNEAIDQACQAMRWLRQTGAQRFMWKYCSTFDSTENGNIGPVAEALMSELGATETVHCPAFPENGRRVFMGNLFVHRQLVSESPMKDHPLTPMRDSNVVRLLVAQVAGDVALLDYTDVIEGACLLRQRIATLARKGAKHIVVDAIDNSNLNIIARACSDMPLICGGSALAMNLPHHYRTIGVLAENSQAPRPPVLNEAAIILSGSASDMTNAQVSDYLQRLRPSYRLDPIDLVERGHAPIFQWLEDQELTHAPLVYATAKPERVRAVQEQLGVSEASRLVEAALAATAVRARELGVRRFIVAGGETSGAVTQALDIEQLEVGPEVTPGVPWCFCQSAGNEIALTLKSGNFGTPSFFSDALSLLEEV